MPFWPAVGGAAPPSSPRSNRETVCVVFIAPKKFFIPFLCPLRMRWRSTAGYRGRKMRDALVHGAPSRRAAPSFSHVVPAPLLFVLLACLGCAPAPFFPGPCGVVGLTHTVSTFSELTAAVSAATDEDVVEIYADISFTSVVAITDKKLSFVAAPGAGSYVLDGSSRTSAFFDIRGTLAEVQFTSLRFEDGGLATFETVSFGVAGAQVRWVRAGQAFGERRSLLRGEWQGTSAPWEGTPRERLAAPRAGSRGRRRAEVGAVLPWAVLDSYFEA